MGARKQQCTMDAVASLIHKVQECWAKKKLAAALLMDVKGAFDYVKKTRLVERIMELGIDGCCDVWVLQ